MSSILLGGHSGGHCARIHTVEQALDTRSVALYGLLLPRVKLLLALGTTVRGGDETSQAFPVFLVT